MRETSDILGVNIDIVDMNETLNIINEFLKGDKTKTVFTPNSEFIMIAREDNEFKDILNSADLLIADGIGVVWASAIMGKKLPGRVTGYDTVLKLFELGKDGSFSFYFLGGEPGIAEKAQLILETKYPNINIKGNHHGYFNVSQDISILNEINTLCPDVLLVALGAPKQEKWIYKNINKLNVKVCMGIGGSFDMISGKTKRAPYIFQKLGLEWLHRLIKQPSRINRFLKLPQFGFIVIWKRLFGK